MEDDKVQMIKKGLKIASAILAGLLLLGGIFFIINPTFWLNILKPVKFTVKTVHTRISENDISIDFRVALSTDSFVNFVIDSLAYQFYLDSTKIAHGTKSIDNEFKSGDVDTLDIPLSIHKDTLKLKLDMLAPTDSTNLKFVFDNYIDFPVIGKTELGFDIDKKIPAPKFPRIEIHNIEDINLKDTAFKIDLKLHNPSVYNVTVTRFDAQIKFEDLFTGKIKNDTPIELKPQGTTVFSTTININDLELIKDGIKLLFRPNKERPYTMDSKITLQQKDGSNMTLEILSSGKMDITGKN